MNLSPIQLANVRKSIISRTASHIVEHSQESGVLYEGSVSTPFGIVVVYSESGHSMNGDAWGFSHYRFSVNGHEYTYSENVLRGRRGLAIKAHQFAKYVMRYEVES